MDDAETRAARLHLVGLTNAGVIIMGVVLGAAVVMLVLLLVSLIKGVSGFSDERSVDNR
jgi:hypothetical protein